MNGDTYELASEQVAAGTLTKTITGLPNLVTIVFGITAVNGSGQESNRTTWSAIQLSADVPVLDWSGVMTGLVSGYVRVFKPTERAGTNPDGLVGQDVYQLDISGVVSTISFGGAAWLDLPAGGLTNGATYSIRLRRKYLDVAPWSADEYYTGWTSAVSATPFAPVAAVLSGDYLPNNPFDAMLSWTVAASVAQYFEAGYYFAIRIVKGTDAPYYQYVYDADSINQTGVVTVDAPGEHTFSIAITNADISGANIPAGVWAATNSVTFTVYDVPEQPGLTNALVFDAAGNATDTFTVSAATFPFPAGRPVTEYRLYDTAGNILIGSLPSSASLAKFEYTYALSALGGTKQFRAFALNQVGQSVPRDLTVSVTGSPPYAARDVTAASVTAQTITASGATATVGWTKYEPNAAYFPVTGFRVDVLSGETWVELGTYAASATTSGALPVTSYVVDGQALTFRVVQLGTGGNSAGVTATSATYTVPAVGTASIQTLTAKGIEITVPWTFTGTLANITELTLDISGMAGTVQTQVPITAASASDIYKYTAPDYGDYSFRIRPMNAFTVGAWSEYKNITIRDFIAPYTYISIAGGISHTAALLADGTVRTWGYNRYGQLGTTSNMGTENGVSAPVVVSGISNSIAIQCGLSHTAALLADGTMRTWGYNVSGQLGTTSNVGTINGISVPVTPDITNAVAISCGYYYTAALLADGTMRTWGANNYGQLGISNTTDQTAPVTPDISNVIAITCGGFHTAALLANGTMRTWGLNNYGQLGISNTTAQSVPVSVSLTNVVAIACGATHTAALLANGTMRTCGWNLYGQLGHFLGYENNRDGVDRFYPVAASNLSNAVAISCTGDNTAALLADGTVKRCGLLVPNTCNMTAVSNLSNVVGIACGGNHTATLIADNTMRTWGANNYGQLGNSNTTAQTTPVSVCNLSNVRIVDPSFALTNITVPVNLDLTSGFFMNTKTGYEPGTVPYRGLAIVGRTGTWEYTTNSGTNWTAIGTVSGTSAIALRLESTVRIRCTAAGILSVKAWSGQQATPATVTTGVDTTVTGATIQEHSFGDNVTTITAS